MISALIFGILSTASTPVVAQSAVPQDLREAARTLAAERRGVIGFHQATVLDQRAPGHNDHQELVSGRLRVDGEIVAIRHYREFMKGKQLSPADIAKNDAEIAKRLPQHDSALPMTEDLFPDYRFAAAACGGCAPGLTAIAFTALKNDENHYDGTVVIDTKTRRFVRIDFHPAVLPKEADSASETVTFARVLSDLWDVTETRQHWTGHVLFIRGSRDVTTTCSNYRRFASIDAGRKGLEAGL